MNEADEYITYMLLDSNLSLKEIASNLDISESILRNKIKLLGLDWIRKPEKSMSRGQTALTNITKKIIPNEQVVNEYHIGERLKLDIFCPKYKVGIEYHGRQHFEHVPHFHETFDDFQRAIKRDERKIELCKELGIALVIFRYTDKLTEDAVYDRILCAIRESDKSDKRIKVKPKSLKDDPRYQELKQKKNTFQRELRKKIKQERKQKEKELKRIDEE